MHIKRASHICHIFGLGCILGLGIRCISKELKVNVKYLGCTVYWVRVNVGLDECKLEQ